LLCFENDPRLLVGASDSLTMRLTLYCWCAQAHGAEFEERLALEKFCNYSHFYG
jgi:hypothetical protein